MWPSGRVANKVLTSTFRNITLLTHFLRQRFSYICLKLSKILIDIFLKFYCYKFFFFENWWKSSLKIFPKFRKYQQISKTLPKLSGIVGHRLKIFFHKFRICIFLKFSVNRYKFKQIYSKIRVKFLETFS